MTIPPNQREARDIVTLVDLIAMDPDPMPAEHLDSIVAAGRAVGDYVRRARLAEPAEAKPSRKVSKPKGDSPELKRSKAEIRRRSGGYCEIIHVGCTGFAQHAHHRRMRSQGGSDEPVNLLDVCTVGHDYIHANPKLAHQRGWLLHAAPVNQ